MSMGTDTGTGTGGAVKKGVATGGSAGVGAVIVWAWNSLVPDMQMDPIVGGAVGGFFGPPLYAAQAWVMNQFGSS